LEFQAKIFETRASNHTRIIEYYNYGARFCSRSWIHRKRCGDYIEVKIFRSSEVSPSPRFLKLPIILGKQVSEFPFW
jgi:hypothetical protein